MKLSSPVAIHSDLEYQDQRILDQHLSDGDGIPEVHIQIAARRPFQAHLTGRLLHCIISIKPRLVVSGQQPGGIPTKMTMPTATTCLRCLASLRMSARPRAPARARKLTAPARRRKSPWARKSARRRCGSAPGHPAGLTSARQESPATQEIGSRRIKPEDIAFHARRPLLPQRDRRRDAAEGHDDAGRPLRRGTAGNDVCVGYQAACRIGGKRDSKQFILLGAAGPSVECGRRQNTKYQRAKQVIDRQQDDMRRKHSKPAATVAIVSSGR